MGLNLRWKPLSAIPCQMNQQASKPARESFPSHPFPSAYHRSFIHMKTKINRRDHLKTLKWILLLALIPASLASAQSIPIPDLCGTGRNTGCTGLQPVVGSADAHWFLATPYPTSASGQPVPLLSTLTFGPAYVNSPVSGWLLPNGPTTLWITPQVTSSPGGNYVYQTTFTIPSGYDPATASISGWWSSDNEGIAAWLNSNTPLTGFPLPAAGPPGGFDAMTNFTITHGVAGATFQPGLNKLTFQLRNRGQGGIDNNPTATGLRVEFTGSAVLPSNYPNTSLQLSGNTIVTPDAAPTSTMSINVSTSTSFKGKLEGAPTTGVVRVTDAHPAGTYPVTVTAFGASGGTTTKSFTLTVTTPNTCTPVRFPPPVPYGAGNNPRSVAIGDFDRDGIQDFVVSLTANQVSVFLGNGTGGTGTGSFHALATSVFNVGTTPEQVVVGDFNGDGIQDLATANAGSGNVSILLGSTGTAGTFSAAVNYNVQNIPRSVAVGDFNGDGKQDLAVANTSSNSVSILLGDGLGSFTATHLPIGFSPYYVAVGDFNRDGKQDLAVTNRSGANNQVSVLLGNGTGGFPAAQTFVVGGNPLSVAVGDFNGDGNQDLAIANTGAADSVNVSVLINMTLTNASTVTFAAANTFPSGGSAPYSVVVGDFDGDGKQDLAVGNQNSNNVSILKGNGDGTFSLVGSPFPAGSLPSAVAVGDFNGDGMQDLAVANYTVSASQTVSILLRQCCSRLYTVTNANQLAAIDVDNACATTIIGVTRDAASPFTVRRIRGLAYDAVSDNMYGMTREGDLVRVNRGNGTTTFLFAVSPHGSPPNFWSGLAFKGTNKLYSTNAFGAHELVEITNVTSATVVGSTTFSGNPLQILGLDFYPSSAPLVPPTFNGTHPAPSVLYGSNRNNDNIVVVNAGNGAVTMPFGNHTVGVPNLQEIAFHPQTGVLYAIQDHFSSSNNAALSTYNFTTEMSTELCELPFGIVETVGGGNDTYGWGGLAFAPCCPGVPPVGTAVSRKNHGACGTFDIPLPQTFPFGTECRSGGVNGVYQIVLAFPSAVTYSGAVVKCGIGTVVSTSGTNPVSINLTGVTDAQVIKVTLVGVDDGVNCGDVEVKMGVLIGDTNGNGCVNATDVSQTKFQSGQTVTGSNFREDVTGNCAITASDISLVKSKSGACLMDACP